MGWRRSASAPIDRRCWRQQLRALLRAAAGKTCCSNSRMIAEIAELEGAPRCSKELARAAAEGVEPPRSLKLGVMLEVPSLLWQLPRSSPRRFPVDRHNDLAQFLFCLRPRHPRPRRALRYAVGADGRAVREVIRAMPAPPTPRSACAANGGQSDRGDGADRARFPHAVLDATAVRAGQDDDPQPRWRALAGYLDEIGDRPDHSLRRWLEAYARDHRSRCK